MDAIRNPFSPGAGSPPPELAGRDAILELANVLFGRVRLKRSEKSMMMTGLRGVGKTVLLYDPSPHPLLCVEEPENQLYPRLLHELAEAFRFAGDRRVDSKAAGFADCSRRRGTTAKD